MVSQKTVIFKQTATSSLVFWLQSTFQPSTHISNSFFEENFGMCPGVYAQTQSHMSLGFIVMGYCHLKYDAK